MYTTLAIFASVLGFLTIGAAAYTAWYYYRLYKRQQSSERGRDGSKEEAFPLTVLLRTSVLDYALTAMVLIGLVFLLADLVGVLKERDLYPYWHYGYLLCGFIFTALGLVLLLVRFFVVLRLAQASLALPHHQHEPSQADHSE